MTGCKFSAAWKHRLKRRLSFFNMRLSKLRISHRRILWIFTAKIFPIREEINMRFCLLSTQLWAVVAIDLLVYEVTWCREQSKSLPSCSIGSVAIFSSVSEPPSTLRLEFHLVKEIVFRGSEPPISLDEHQAKRAAFDKSTEKEQEQSKSKLLRNRKRINSKRRRVSLLSLC